AEDGNGTVLIEDDVVPVLELDEAQIVVAKRAFELGFDLRLFEHCGGSSTDVERTHGKLRAGLADGLSGDDTGGLAKLDQSAGREIAPVAGFADAVLAFASEHRADFDFLNAGRINLPGLDFVNV